eukprot:1159932-Rhodomonas_salina.2
MLSHRPSSSSNTINARPRMTPERAAAGARSQHAATHATRATTHIHTQDRREAVRMLCVYVRAREGARGRERARARSGEGAPGAVCGRVRGTVRSSSLSCT